MADVEGRCRFIQQNYRCILRKDTCKGHPRAFTTGKRADISSCKMSNARCFEGGFDKLIVEFGLGCSAPRASPHRYDIAYQKFEGHRDILKHHRTLTCKLTG